MRTGSGRGAARGRAAGQVVEAGREQQVAEGCLDGRWLVLGKDGRLTAYARSRAGLLRWTETRPGGPHWSEPDLIPVPDLTDLSVTQGADTYVHFLGRVPAGVTGRRPPSTSSTPFSTRPPARSPSGGRWEIRTRSRRRPPASALRWPR